LCELLVLVHNVTRKYTFGSRRARLEETMGWSYEHVEETGGEANLVSDESGRDKWHTGMGRRRHQERIWQQEMSRNFQKLEETIG
jgi:hypothetical protein